MSSMSLSVSRKRSRCSGYRESDNSDSDIDIDVRPLKRRRNCGNRVLPLAIKEKLQSLVLWFNDLKLPGTSFFTMALKSGIEYQQEIILEDGEEIEVEDDEVQEVTEVDPEQLVPLIEKFEKKLYASRSRKTFEQNGACSISSRFDFHGMNGSSSRNSGIHRFNNFSSRDSRTDNLKRSAVVTNPSTDIEILLGAKPKVPAPEADEIEILSELSSTKKHSSSQKSLSMSRSSSTKSSISRAGPSSNSVKRLQSSTAKGFTANEVVRLQEKAQYKLLLDKYISESHYYHVVKKPHSVDASVQADIQLPGTHFQKEILKQPIHDYIEQYYKPCQLASSDNDKKTSEEPPEIQIDDDQDDDLQILEVKLPQVKPKFRSRKYFTPEWLAELRTSVRAQTAERLKIVEEQERLLERYKKDRVLNRLSIDDHVSQTTEPEFPELTPEMEEAVDAALSVGPPNEFICKSINSGDLLRKDMETLGGLNWLNDTVINSYFDLIVARSKQDDFPSAYAYNTFFYSTYKTKGYSSVQRWTRKVDIFSFDLNFIPIHLGVHWCLAVIDHRAKKICYYDSMGNGEEQCLYLLNEYLCMEYKNKKGAILDSCTYASEAKKEIPQQMNGGDCGMFTLKYAEYISRDAEITFNQSHMQYFRRRTVYELLKGQLL